MKTLWFRAVFIAVWVACAWGIQAQSIPAPTAGFAVTVNVSLDQALAIHTALTSGRPGGGPATTVQQAVQQILDNQIAAMVEQGLTSEADGIKLDLQSMSQADRNTIKALIAKLRKRAGPQE
jgi:hypothetical protein